VGDGANRMTWSFGWFPGRGRYSLLPAPARRLPIATGSSPQWVLADFGEVLVLSRSISRRFCPHGCRRMTRSLTCPSKSVAGCFVCCDAEIACPKSPAERSLVERITLLAGYVSASIPGAFPACSRPETEVLLARHACTCPPSSLVPTAALRRKRPLDFLLADMR